MIADLGLYDLRGQLVGIAEVKNKIGTSPEWAAQFRRNLLAHGTYPRAAYFLIVTPDRVYLWGGDTQLTDTADPHYAADIRLMLEPYFQRAGVEPDVISGPAFEFLVSAWLSDLLRSLGNGNGNVGLPDWQVQSGLLKAVRNGRIEYEVAT